MKRHFLEPDIRLIATDVLAHLSSSPVRAAVLALHGELGAGKTTLTKAISDELGILETVVSPTFVIAKFYDTMSVVFPKLVHIDAYRIESAEELASLSFHSYLSMPHTLIIIEWPERISKAIPSDAFHVHLAHAEDGRTISYGEN